MAKYDYNKFFENFEFDFFDNSDLAIYLENAKFVGETMDYLVLQLDYALYGDITPENLSDWKNEFKEDMEDFESFESIVNSHDRLMYNVKQGLKLYFDKDIINECIRLAEQGKSGEVAIEHIIKMVTTTNYEDKIFSDDYVVDDDIVADFSCSVGFPILDDASVFSGVFMFGIH